MNRRRRGLCAAAVAALGLAALIGPGAAAQTSPATSAAAPASVTAQRQATMKSFGFALRDTALFANGQAAFDPAKVKASMEVVAKGAKSARTLFPPESATEPGTAADPKIWTEKADFIRRLEAVSKLAATAQRATDAEAFKTSFTALSQDCKSCHDVYRRKKG